MRVLSNIGANKALHVEKNAESRKYAPCFKIEHSITKYFYYL